MKTIDLGKILFDQVDKLREDYPDINLYSDEDMKVSPEYNYFINAMKEACRQTLELATENVLVRKENYFDLSAEEQLSCIEVYLNEESDIPASGVIADKFSILNTIN